MTGWEIVPVAISPILGHAFSPFLKFKGGKAVATTFGVWSGLTIGTGPILLGALLGLFYILLDSSGWSVMITLVLFGSFVINYYTSAPEFIWIWLGNLIVVFWKHQSELRKFPGIRPEILSVFRRRK
jgi:glycerol-3-phosphate acyltransferase PlsY